MTPTHGTLRTLLASLGILAAGALILPVTAAAQSPGASETSLDSAAVQQLSQIQHPGSWGASGTFGVQLQDGRAGTRGWDLDLILYRVTEGGTLFRLDTEWRRAEYEPAGASDFITVDDRRTASLTAITTPGGFPLIGVASWRRDVPVKLDHRIMAEVGPYLGWSPTPRVHMDFAPFIGGGTQDNHASAESESIATFGGLHSMTWHPTNTSTFQTYLKGHRNFEESDDYALDLNVSLKAMLNAHLGLSLSYQLSLEGIHPDDRGIQQHTVGAGINVSFSSAAPSGR